MQTGQLCLGAIFASERVWEAISQELEAVRLCRLVVLKNFHQAFERRVGQENWTCGSGKNWVSISKINYLEVGLLWVIFESTPLGELVLTENDKLNLDQTCAVTSRKGQHIPISLVVTQLPVIRHTILHEDYVFLLHV